MPPSWRGTSVARSEVTIDLAALRHNVRRLLEALAGAELWAVVKADAYGHGAADVAGAVLDAGASARCGIALYGLSPFGGDPADHDLRPVLSWRSELAEVRRLAPGGSTGYGRRFIAIGETWIGLVPVGYADGFRRDLTGTQVLVEGKRRRAIGRVSMDSFAVALPGELPVGTPVTLIGDGLLAEEHARVAGTITYELV